MSNMMTMQMGKPLKRYFMDWSEAFFSPSHEKVYPSGRDIFSISFAIALRAASVPTPGQGEHCSR